MRDTYAHEHGQHASKYHYAHARLTLRNLRTASGTYAPAGPGEGGMGEGLWSGEDCCPTCNVSLPAPGEGTTKSNCMQRRHNTVQLARRAAGDIHTTTRQRKCELMQHKQLGQQGLPRCALARRCARLCADVGCPRAAAEHARLKEACWRVPTTETPPKNVHHPCATVFTRRTRSTAHHHSRRA